ncbi:MAG: DEAD/DEAH box helicase [Bacteroidaceae bacterium]|nr:DEAD/DEAH box helicase [Bacteroidaceae bacterium]
MKYADLPKDELSHLVKPRNKSLEEWQVMLRMQQARREEMDVECVSERYSPGEYRVSSKTSGRVYKVVFRGAKSPWNYCDCMDFKTSQLGTCKHVEAARQWIADHHKRIHWDLPAYTSVYLSYRGNIREVKIRIGDAASKEFRLMAAKYFNELDTLRPEAYERFGEFMRQAKALCDDFRCYQDAIDFILEQRESIARRKVIDETYTDQHLDALLSTTLYPYQREGVRFAAKAGRAILADEMGLGKTVQAIATAELLMREGFITNVLVLCPATLKYQWKREIERFTERTAVVIDGAPERRRELAATEAEFKIESYNAFTDDVKAGHLLHCDMLVLDEVQRLKNWNTQMAKAVRQIRSRYALILSGTPLENRLEELYSIVELVDQFILAPYYLFRDRYIITDSEGRTIGYQALDDVRRRLTGIMLRRRKSDVELQLPPRIDKNLFVPMTPEQMAAHQELRINAAHIVSKWHRQHFLSEIDRRSLLLTLQQMRMACDSLFLLDEHSRFDTKVEETMNILNECGITVNGEGHDNTAEDYQTPKIVIFSQWERMTRIVAQELERSGVDYTYIHGNVPARQRQQRVDAFQSDPSVRVFLSTDAGAVGLNLQAANIVINLDLPWNPAIIEQRIGRIHRIGQQRGVEVINLIAAGTIEDDMRSRLRFKASLFDGVLDGGEEAVFLGDDKFDSLLTGIEEYIDEETDNSTHALSASTAEPQQAAQQKKEGSDEALLSRLAADLAELLLTDEATRSKAAQLLRSALIH